MASKDYVDSGKRFVDNLAENVSPAYLGNVYSGRSVAFNGDGYVDLPINLELESEIITNPSDFQNIDGWHTFFNLGTLSLDTTKPYNRIKFEHTNDNYIHLYNDGGVGTEANGKTFLLKLDLDEVQNPSTYMYMGLWDANLRWDIIKLYDVGEYALVSTLPIDNTKTNVRFGIKTNASASDGLVIDIDMTGMNISSTVQIQFTRTDSSTGDVYATFADAHIERDTIGSRGQYSK